MLRLVRGRRSVRRYRNENVDSTLVRTLLSAAANAPSGVNSRQLTFTVIDDKEVMQRFRETALIKLKVAAENGRLPAQFAYLQQAVPAWFEHKVDVLFRGAPHLLIVSASPAAVCPQEDVRWRLPISNFSRRAPASAPSGAACSKCFSLRCPN